MDFDLFALDDDDDLLASIYIEATQQPTQQPNVEEFGFAELNCEGEDTLRSQFSNDGFVRSGFFTNNRKFEIQKSAANEITLTNYEFNAQHLKGQGVLRFVVGKACLNIQNLVASVRRPTVGASAHSFYQQRHHVTQLYYLLLYTTSESSWPLLRTHVESLRRLLNRVTEPDSWKLIYFANSPKGNECNTAAYHLLHGALEWKLLDLCLIHTYEIAPLQHDERLETCEKDKIIAAFTAQLNQIFTDLIQCSLHWFAKKRSVDLYFSSPFPCTCFKELWLCLQLALPNWSEGCGSSVELDFWMIFNKCMTGFKQQLDKYSLTPLTYVEFINWLLPALMHLFGYRSNGQFEGPHYARAINEAAENYEFYENCTQQFLNANPSEEQLRLFICLQLPILLEWWRPKSNIPMLMWEHFHKRLNSSFYIAGAAPSNLAVACGSGRAYLNRYRALLEQQKPDVNLSSFTIFTLLFGKMLARLIKSHQNHQAQKLLGRIYTKFSIQKLIALTETGIHHLIELFLVLALCGEFNELAPKLRDQLLSIAFEKITTAKQVALAKGHMALLLLHAEQQYDFSEYAKKLLQQLASVRHEVSVSKIFADSLLDIFTLATDFKRGEHLLIDVWIPNLLQNCTPVEQERCLEALHLIFVKLQESGQLLDTNAELSKALHAFILPFLKQHFVTNFSPWLPQLAADFCIHASTNSEANNFQKLFQYFSEAQTANRLAQPQFLLRVLASDKSSLVESKVIMQIWLKSLVLLSANNEDVVNLTNFVIRLADFQYMVGAAAVEEVERAKEPLCVFIAAVGKNYDSCTNFADRCKIADNLNDYLRNFEKWLQPELKLEKTEITFRFYSFLAIVIYNCAQIVYVKSKITCFFHIVMTRFVLPTNIQMGKPPEGKLSQLIHKVWPVMVQGMGRLNFKSDPYINKTLTDLVQKWTPHFKISPNSKIVARPFITCLQGDNHELSLFVFEKLTNMFLSTQRRQAAPNACLVITIFQEIVETISTAPINTCEENEMRLSTFMKGTCLLMLEHVMMVDEVVPSRKLLLDLFKRLTTGVVFRQAPQLRELLAEHLRLLIKKHLSYYTFFLFELLMKLAEFAHDVIQDIMEFLKTELHVVEQKRGIGEDNRLRGCLQKLQEKLPAEGQKNSSSM